MLKKDSVVNSLIFLVYSEWSLREHGLDCEYVVETRKHKERKTPNKLRIMKHLRTKRSRVIL